MSNAMALTSIVLAIGVSSCRVGGGGGGSGDGGSGFDVQSVSVSLQGGRVYLNEVIEIEFTKPVNPATVLSGIYIYPSESAGGRRAAGTFEVDGTTVRFRPALPTAPDLMDGGLIPDTEYTICMPNAGASCAVFVQNTNGVRTPGGRGLPETRSVSFETVRVTDRLFVPEAVPERPQIESVLVRDASGVTQVVHPILDVVTGTARVAGIYSTVRATPPTTLGVPSFDYRAERLDGRLVTTIDRRRDVAGGGQVAVSLRNLSTAMANGSFEERGATLTIRDRATPPNEATWVVETNTVDRVFAAEASGPSFASVPFVGDTLDVIIEEGVTRAVDPGDGIERTTIEVAFSEPLHPSSVIPDAFELYSRVDDNGTVTFSRIALASQRLSPAGVTHRIVDGKSRVILRPESGLPFPVGRERVTILLRPVFASSNNASPATAFSFGLRDVNDFSLAYPRRAGARLAQRGGGGTRTVEYIQPLAYATGQAKPRDRDVVYGFDTRNEAARAVIVETFSDGRGRSSDCRSTASWALPGEPGLFAAYGYGGSGVDGSLVVDASTTLDSSTRRPDGDGIVNWDFTEVTVRPGATLNLLGTHPIRLNALRDIRIEGTIDAGGLAGGNAAPGAASTVGLVAGGRGGPGAGTGGSANPDPSSVQFPEALRGGPGRPRGTACMLNVSVNDTGYALFNCGGATGGNRGASSGLSLRSGCTGAGGGHLGAGERSPGECFQTRFTEATDRWVVLFPASSVPAPTAATGGGAGGNAATVTGPAQPLGDVVGGGGGGGGGGLELAAAGTLELTGVAQVLADGGSGGVGATTLIGSSSIRGGYGGGGGGGSVWLSGTSVVVDTNVVISAVGGVGNPNVTRNRGYGGVGYVVIRDRDGTPDVRNGARTTPTAELSRSTFAPAANGESVAYSRWYDSRRADPRWRFDSSSPASGDLVAGEDLRWLEPPAANQIARIFFQAAPDLNGVPDPDPRTWFPANTASDPCANWETDLAKINQAGRLRHLRFKIEFSIGRRDEGAPPPPRIGIERLRIRY